MNQHKYARFCMQAQYGASDSEETTCNTATLLLVSFRTKELYLASSERKL